MLGPRRARRGGTQRDQTSSIFYKLLPSTLGHLSVLHKVPLQARGCRLGRGEGGGGGWGRPWQPVPAAPRSRRGCIPLNQREKKKSIFQYFFLKWSLEADSKIILSDIHWGQLTGSQARPRDRFQASGQSCCQQPPSTGGGREARRLRGLNGAQDSGGRSLSPGARLRPCPRGRPTAPSAAPASRGPLHLCWGRTGPVPRQGPVMHTHSALYAHTQACTRTPTHTHIHVHTQRNIYFK